MSSGEGVKGVYLVWEVETSHVLEGCEVPMVESISKYLATLQVGVVTSIVVFGKEVLNFRNVKTWR